MTMQCSVKGELKHFARTTAKLQSIRHRITYKLCVLMHLVHTGRGPSYLSNLVTVTANMPFRKRHHPT